MSEQYRNLRSLVSPSHHMLRLKSQGDKPFSVDVARIQHQDMVRAFRVALFRAIEKPKLAGQGLGIEKVAADIDHYIDSARLYQLPAHDRLIPSGAGRLGRHDHASAAVFVQIAVEIGHSQVVGVRDLLALVHAMRANRQPCLVVFHFLGVNLVDVEGRIGHHEVALADQLVPTLILIDGFVSCLYFALKALDG